MESLLIRASMLWGSAKQRLSDQKGQSMVEYALVISLVIGMVIIAFAVFDLSATLTALKTKIEGQVK